MPPSSAIEREVVFSFSSSRMTTVGRGSVEAKQRMKAILHPTQGIQVTPYTFAAKKPRQRDTPSGPDTFLVRTVPW